MKRLKNTIGSAGYAQIGFNYDQPATSASNATGEQAIDSGGDDSKDAADDEKDETDEVYVPHPKFVIPADMDLPETTKVHAIIEKTAKFIAGQGAQMEILIKAKQANNPLFEFLNQNSRLNRFYKHMLQTMKDGKYPEASDRPTNAQNEKSEMQMQGTSMPDYYSSTANYSKVNRSIGIDIFGEKVVLTPFFRLNFADLCANREIQTLGRLCVHTTHQQNQRNADSDRGRCATREYTVAGTTGDYANIGRIGIQHKAHSIE